ncbi:hypothetical protein F4677DRAFT_449948 [Hypoxylon crocopeplum]|nr:hypothetical protein F4677DRAFT_449948 [Hypoxylon crocopeplum]
MPHNSSTSGQKTKSKRRSKSGKDRDSTKTHRGSPVPHPPDESDPSRSSARTHNGHDNIDQDLLGFGAQFDKNK